MFILFPDRDLNHLLTVSDLFRPVLQRFRAAQSDTTTILIASVLLLAVLLSRQINAALFVITPAFLSLVSVVWKGWVIRPEPERCTYVSTILTLPEFALGVLRAAPFVVLYGILLEAFLAVVMLAMRSVGNTHDAISLPFLQEIGASGIALCLAALPLAGTAKAIKNRNLPTFPLSFLRIAGVWIAMTPVLFLVYLLDTSIILYILYGMIALGVVPLLLVLWLTLQRGFALAGAWRHDRARLAGATAKFLARRTEIATAFQSLETAQTRNRYIDWVEREATTHDHLAALADIVANPWPNGRRPNLGDPASTRLARLDERWLKLDV
jgi:hypothetical protein